MHEYPLLFKGLPEEEKAVAFAAKVRDVSVLLDELGFDAPPPLPRPMSVAYHDACHLAHAQGIREAPRALLSAIPGLELREIPEGDLCCGSAGTYNLEHPGIARALGDRKAGNILATGAEMVATGNIGCMLQIQGRLQALGHSITLLHTVQVLDRAYSQSL
jgi:glycolate oxidase iron-sulfur subunit